MIKSGQGCLAFVLQNGRSLTTFRKELPVEEQFATTSVILQLEKNFFSKRNQQQMKKINRKGK